MEIQLLGDVEVRAGGSVLDIGSPKQRLVFAALAAAPGQVVPLEVLIDRVWGEDLPARPAATLYPYLSQLRGVLNPAGVAIVRRSGGYACEVPPDCVDVARFRDLLQAGKAADAAGSIESVSEALALWRGTPLAGLSGDWVIRFRDTLSQERLSAWLLLARHRHEGGDLAVLADDLLRTAGEYPLSEPLAGYVISALAMDGRRLEALDYYARLRTYLADELGEEPGDGLRDLHLQLLRRAPEFGTHPAPGEPARVVPRQLPVLARRLAGREAELHALDELIASSKGETATAISVITGTAGIGKTAIAVYWAHRAADQFPDGQLFVNLRGFDPGAEPMPAIDAVRAFLEALGTSPGSIPRQDDAQIAMFRSLIAQRRMLVLLDNARDVEQVRPLLPGGPGCLVVVTSRHRLTGLVAEHGALPIHLDLLSEDEAEQLLQQRLGTDRVSAERTATAELVERCARLPLALAVVAGRAAADPRTRMASIAADLADQQKRLDVLDTQDQRTTLRAVFTSSYNALTPPGQRMFRLLGLHPGPDISLGAATSLAGIDVAATTRVLRELRYASLLSEWAPGRYTFHDLLRAYATELSGSDLERESAVHRMFDHYVHTAHGAERLLAPHRDPATPVAVQAGVLPEKFPDAGQALDWFARERHVLLAAVDLATTMGFDRHVTQLTEAFGTFLDQQGLWQDWVTMEKASLAAARRWGDRTAEGMAHRGLGLAYARLHRFPEATAALEAALDLYQAEDDRSGEAKTHLIYSHFLSTQERHAEALEHSSRALELQKATGNRTGQGRALSNLAWENAKLGNFRQAISDGEQAIALLGEIGDRKGQGATWDSLGYVHHHLGDYHQAHACYLNALDLWRQIGHQYFEVSSLTDLGNTHLAAGDRDTARRTWHQALEVLESLDHAAADRARAKLLNYLTATD